MKKKQLAAMALAAVMLTGCGCHKSSRQRGDHGGRRRQKRGGQPEGRIR